MATGALRQTVTVNFELEAGDDPASFVLEASNRPGEEPGLGYFLAHPNTEGVTITTNMGSALKIATGQNRLVEEYITYEGAAEAYLRYPLPSGVEFEVVGRFYDTEAKEFTPVVVYDAGRRALKLDQVGYGVIRVRYQAPYELWQVRYPLDCSVEPEVDTTQYGPDDVYPDTRIEVVVFGFKEATNERQSTTVEITPCYKQGGDAYWQSGGSPARLVVEADSEYAARLSKQNGSGLSATGRFRVYPAIGADVITTGGEPKLIDTGRQLSVKEGLVFSGTASVKTKYQPEGSVALETIGYLVTIFGDTIFPSFAKAGDLITTATWLGPNTYTNLSSRIVEADEIVALNDGIAIPVIGVVVADYTTTYDLYEIDFIQGSAESIEFTSVYILARADEATGQLKFDPPSMKGYD